MTCDRYTMKSRSIMCLLRILRVRFRGVNLHRRERLVFIHDYKYAQIMTSKLHVILAIIKEMRRKITHIRTRET
ncbi:hypothetical protein DNHGIG_24810 [Collibacillus ludicampi]|uniref:Uncharacterized protein n=1 Tax=Collibacillus ludicampi TaxID=2771369 RepID=A0AAV4LHN4_9BACL|nr:hypothetical protein DNHGIG_24810 [Collibacillus ludicampi]